MSEVIYALSVLREHEAALKRKMAFNAILDAYEAGHLTHAQWAELCTRIPGLEAAYQRMGTHTDN